MYILCRECDATKLVFEWLNPQPSLLFCRAVLSISDEHSRILNREIWEAWGFRIPRDLHFMHCL